MSSCHSQFLLVRSRVCSYAQAHILHVRWPIGAIVLFSISRFHFPYYAAVFQFFLFSRFHLSYCNCFSLAATMPPHQRANDCRMWTRPPRHDPCYRSLCFVDQCYLSLLSLARKLSLSPPNCTAQFARTDTLGLRATRATELYSGPARCVHRRTPCAQTRKTSKKRLIAASRSTQVPPFLN